MTTNELDTENQVITKVSSRSVEDTVARLTEMIEAKGMKLFAISDHTAARRRRRNSNFATRNSSSLAAPPPERR
jgi:uncharacterized protein (DUF302 family)